MTEKECASWHKATCSVVNEVCIFMRLMLFLFVYFYYVHTNDSQILKIRTLQLI